jgi:hypothetical protein
MVELSPVSSLFFFHSHISSSTLNAQAIHGCSHAAVFHGNQRQRVRVEHGGHRL